MWITEFTSSARERVAVTADNYQEFVTFPCGATRRLVIVVVVVVSLACKVRWKVKVVEKNALDRSEIGFE